MLASCLSVLARCLAKAARRLAVPNRCLAMAHKQLASLAERYLMMTSCLARVARGHLNKAAQDKMKARGLISAQERGNDKLKAFTTVLSGLKWLASK